MHGPKLKKYDQEKRPTNINIQINKIYYMAINYKTSYYYFTYFTIF